MQRQMNRMSQSDLGRQLGVSFQQVQKYENGRNRVSASRLQQLTAIFGVPVAYFFKDAGQAVSLLQGHDAYLGTFVATAQGRELNTAFRKIASLALRKQIASLVEVVAEEGHVEEESTPRD
ncbi:helix-turn-helix domain-containing protein [Ciceribacter sp. RN22]|nr:helix-turn-helix domain-containing protein [Ciceribacter sp. RN22]